MNAVANDLVCALDASRFAVERLQWKPDPWQGRFLRSSSRRILLNCSRQSGKSTTTAVKACHRAVYHPGSMILLISKSLRQSGELFLKVKGFMSRIDNPKVELVEDNKLSMQLSNGSRIVSLPSQEETVRSFSAVNLLIEDEAAFVPDSLHKAIRPMLAVSRGQLILMSSPFGKRGHFYRAWEAPKKKWEKYEVNWQECPRITEATIQEELEEFGQSYVDQEYCCRFVETEDSVFRHEDIFGAVTNDVMPLFAETA